MRNLFKNIAFEDWNKMLLDLSGKLPDVNYIQMVTAANEQKMSIVCLYQPCSEYIVYDPASENQVSARTSRDDFYYGLHPELSSNAILRAVHLGCLSSGENLRAFMAENADKFHMHVGQEKYLPAMFAKTILRMASRFGIRACCGSEGFYRSVLKILSRYPNDFVEHITFQRDDAQKTVDFLGGMSQSAAARLSENGLCLVDEQNGLHLAVGQKENALAFDRFYNGDAATKKYFRLCSGHVYYSGVLPRTLKILNVTDDYSNISLQITKIIVERTTFAMVDACDYSDICAHPLLQNWKSELGEFDRYEDDAQQKYLRAPDGSILERVNRYLDKSFNTHTIAVSGNIVTKDGYCLIAKRNRGTIDGGTYYCSVNGQSEFADENVDFYMQSVLEDMPTLTASNTRRIDFEQELNREAFAELSLAGFEKAWTYYGLSVLGIDNSNIQSVTARRCHFNVLAFNATNKNLAEILSGMEDATEKFENHTVVGVKTNAYKNSIQKIRDRIKGMLQLLVKSSGVVTAVLALVYFAISFLINSDTSGSLLDTIHACVSAFLSASVLLLAVMEIRKKMAPYLIVRKHRLTLSINVDGGELSAVRRQIAALQQKHRMHAILLLMYGLHVAQKISEA